MAHLARAIALDAAGELRIPAADVLAMPRGALRARAGELRDWLDTMVRSDRMSWEEIGRYRDYANRLCTE